MKSRVYLAGPIAGLRYGETVNWRENVKELLAPEIDAYSPMRSKEYLRHYDTAVVPHAASESVIKDCYEGFPLSSQRGIVTRDFHDCRNADLLFVNLLGSQRVSIGTMFEIAWAYQNRTPIVLIMEEHGNPHDHGFVREAAGFRVTTLEEAIDITRCVLLP